METEGKLGFLSSEVCHNAQAPLCSWSLTIEIAQMAGRKKHRKLKTSGSVHGAFIATYTPTYTGVPSGIDMPNIMDNYCFPLMEFLLIFILISILGFKIHSSDAGLVSFRRLYPFLSKR